MKKALTVILSAITLITLAISIISQNPEIWGLKMEWITIASTIILAIKQFIEQSGLLTPEEAAQFSNYQKDNQVYLKSGGHSVDEQDVKNWMKNYKG